jgi:hypothetical protein
MVVRALDDAGITVDDVEVHQPSLDDVFFALTGHPTVDADKGPGGTDDHGEPSWTETDLEGASR